LNRALPQNVIISGDCGTSTLWYARYIDVRKGMLATLSGTLATMGSGVPYALAAKVGHSDRPGLAIVGDGAMQMNGINALITVAQQYRNWRDPRLVIVVLNNQQLSYVTWEQRVMEGDPKFPPSQDLMDFPFARYAELLGLEAARVASPDELADVYRRAFAAKRPFLIEAVTDPNAPPLPPELTEEQKKKLEQSFKQADPDVPAAQHLYERFQAVR
jgi:pyruvate dehydrogenase (quinone)